MSFVRVSLISVSVVLSLSGMAQAGADEILGRWTHGTISSIQYENAVTGAPAPTNGTSFSYEFRDDGTYSYTGLMQMVMSGCTTATFSNETGTYEIDGDTVALSPEKNPYKQMFSCSPNSTRESPGKLVARSFRFEVFEEGDWTRIKLIDSSGSGDTFSKRR